MPPSSADLMHTLDAIRDRVGRAASLLPGRVERVSLALRRVLDALEDGPPATVEDLVDRLDRREGGPGLAPGPDPSTPLTAWEEGALQQVRGIADRIAELHRSRTSRRYELTVEYHPVRREVTLIVLPGPRLGGEARRPSLRFRLNRDGQGLTLAVLDPAGEPDRVLGLGAGPGSVRQADVESFVVAAVDRFLDTQFPG